MFQRRRLRASLYSVTLALTAGCGLGTDPGSDLPAGAEPLVAPTEYQAWFSKTEACSGATGNYGHIEWYVVPGVRTFETDIGEKTGLWIRQGKHMQIIIAGEYTARELVVRHEMLHAILNRAGHPPEYFVDKCHLTWESWAEAHGNDAEPQQDAL